jgi:hypothetical protein
MKGQAGNQHQALVSAHKLHITIYITVGIPGVAPALVRIAIPPQRTTLARCDTDAFSHQLVVALSGRGFMTEHGGLGASDARVEQGAPEEGASREELGPIEEVSAGPAHQCAVSIVHYSISHPIAVHVNAVRAVDP